MYIPKSAKNCAVLSTVIGTATLITAKYSNNNDFAEKFKFLSLAMSNRTAYCLEVPTSPTSFSTAATKTSDVVVDKSNMDEKKMVFAAVYFRHGTRTPIVSEKYFENIEYPASLVTPPLDHTNVPYVLFNIEDQKLGQPPTVYDSRHERKTLKGGSYQGKLTSKGQNDAYQLGLKLKSRYIDEYNLVSEQYSNKEVRSYTTNFSRTIQSLRCVLAGTFGKSINESNMAKIYTRRNEDDYHFPNAEFCPALGRWVFWVHSAQWSVGACQLIKQKVLDIVKDRDLLPNPLKLWDSLVSQRTNGLTIPKEFEELMDEIEECASSVEKWASYGDDYNIASLSIGKLIDDFLVMCDKTIKYEKLDEAGRNSRWYHCHGAPFKLNLISCHDTMLVALVTSLGAFDDKWPKLSSYFSFELYMDKNNNPFIRCFYNDKPIITRNTDADGFIDYKVFLEHYERIRMTKSWKKACLE